MEELKFMEFSSPEEMVAWLAKSRAEVESRSLAPEQEAITWGSTAIRWHDDLILFGRMIELDTLTPDERDHFVAKERDGWLFGQWCSVVEVEGDYGSVHRSAMWPIQAAVYEAASAVRWDPHAMNEYARLSLETAYHEAKAHTS